MKGMIVYSFAWRRLGHSPCNIRLARAAKRIIENESKPVLIFAQRTTALILKEEFGIECRTPLKLPGYEGAKEVTQQAVEMFRAVGITEVIPVAQPFLQLTKCLQLVRKEGFKTPSFLQLARMIGWIGFDQLSAQPWTRDPFRLVYYTIRQMFFGYKSPADLSQ